MNDNIENFSKTSDLLNSDLLNAASVAVPVSDDLQRRILVATKSMPQEPAIAVQNKKSSLWARLSWPVLPIAVAASLALAIWVPVNQNLDSAKTASTVAPVSGVSTNEVANSEEALLSFEELELYELLLLQDELILAQF